MNIAQLKDYRKWIGKRATEILQDVKAQKGWAIIFQEKLPVWAHRIRNYLNVTPAALKLVDEKAAKELVKGANKFGFTDDALASLALNGDVYVDKAGRKWFQMRATGSVYHYEGEGGPLKQAKAALRPKTWDPIFKLVSPDGTGGSLEICIHNLQTSSTWYGTEGQATIGPVNEWVAVKSLMVTDPAYEATYNYSETVEVGFAAHKLRDIDPHEILPQSYIDPPMFSALEERLFPEKDPEGKELASQT